MFTVNRKLILCALRMSSPAKAREIYGQMSDSNQRDPYTQYLLYKLALRCKDQELGKHSIDSDIF